jgi:hypothetical protein
VNVKKILETIYLGDRFCKKWIYDFERKVIMVQMDCISRLHENTETWDCYTKRDIENGYIVFEGVSDIKKNGEMNDEIYSILIEREENHIFHFKIFGVYINEESVSSNVEMTFRAEEMYLLDPKFPEKKISE